jgi:hypothetical protein
MTEQWKARGLCGSDPDGWFAREWAAKVAAARRCTGLCPVYAKCYAMTIADEERGLTPFGGVQAGIVFNEKGSRIPWKVKA